MGTLANEGEVDITFACIAIIITITVIVMAFTFFATGNRIDNFFICSEWNKFSNRSSSSTTLWNNFF